MIVECLQKQSYQGQVDLAYCSLAKCFVPPKGYEVGGSLDHQSNEAILVSARDSHWIRIDDGLNS